MDGLGAGGTTLDRGSTRRMPDATHNAITEDGRDAELSDCPRSRSQLDPGLGTQSISSELSDWPRGKPGEAVRCVNPEKIRCTCHWPKPNGAKQQVFQKGQASNRRLLRVGLLFAYPVPSTIREKREHARQHAVPRSKWVKTHDACYRDMAPAHHIDP